MVKCEDCKKEMAKAGNCNKEFAFIKLDGKRYRRNLSYFDVNGRCHDCNIINNKGNLHHFGCDIERCPKCKGQIISCECWKNDYDKEEDYKNA